MDKQCNHCNHVFKTTTGLKNHLKKQRKILHEGRNFCNNAHLQRHLRSITKPETIPDLNQQIFPNTSYQNLQGYQDIIKVNYNQIMDHHKITKYYEVKNKEISSSFTYNELYQYLLGIYAKRQKAYKINLGVGIILYNPLEEQYQYHYVSTNNLLFEYAKTISSRKDITKLMKNIISLDLPTAYYLQRPSSKWVLSGITNIETRIYNLNALLG